MTRPTIARRSWDRLGLEPGAAVFAQIKGIALIGQAGVRDDDEALPDFRADPDSAEAPVPLAVRTGSPVNP